MDKCFIGNYDGRRQGLIIAKSQKEAAEIIGRSVRDLRLYWRSRPLLACPIENPKRGVLYTKPYDCRDTEWTEGRCELPAPKTYGRAFAEQQLSISRYAQTIEEVESKKKQSGTDIA